MVERDRGLRSLMHTRSGAVPVATILITILAVSFIPGGTDDLPSWEEFPPIESNGLGGPDQGWYCRLTSALEYETFGSSDNNALSNSTLDIDQGAYDRFWFEVKMEDGATVDRVGVSAHDGIRIVEGPKFIEGPFPSGEYTLRQQYAVRADAPGTGNVNGYVGTYGIGDEPGRWTGCDHVVYQVH